MKFARFALFFAALFPLSTAFVQAAGMNTVSGFSGVFAPKYWQYGSNPQSPFLIDTSGAPAAVSLRNHSAWDVSGSAFTFPQAPAAGRVTFSYTTTNTSSTCPAAYVVGSQVQKLSTASGRQTAAFNVGLGQSFGFVLNGNATPTDFGCDANGAKVKFTVSDFVFTPASVPVSGGFYGQFAAVNWTQWQRVGGLIDTSGAPASVALNGILTDSIGGAKATFVYNGQHSAGTVTFTYSFLGQYAPNCWAQYLKDGVRTQLASADPDAPVQASFTVAANESFGFALGGPVDYNNGCQVSGSQKVPFKISQFNFTPSTSRK